LEALQKPKKPLLFEAPQKTLLFETPDPLQQSPSPFKDTGLFLSPATQKSHNSIEKATKLSEVVYNSQEIE
jgi:hypothetical protein